MSVSLEDLMLDELLNNVNQVLFIRDAFTENHDIIYVNDAYEKFWGRTKESLIQNPESYFESVHPEDREMVIGMYENFLNGNIEYEKDYRIIRADGEVRWVFAKTFAIYNEKGEAYRIAGLVEDITERKETELSVSLLNEVQSGVIKMLAHDLRSPIAGIKLIANLLKNARPTEVVEHATRIIDSCDNTLLMMDDLLSHIQMHSNGVFVNKSKFIIEDEIESICSDFKERMKQKSIALYLPSSKNEVKLDAIKFRQIVSNLITNAIKFNYPKGEIHIKVEKSHQNIVLKVKDTGVGVSDSNKDEIFEIFTKARREGTIGEKSNGLGLSITKRLIDLHDGNIEVQSIPDRGTCMVVSFPI